MNTVPNLNLDASVASSVKFAHNANRVGQVRNLARQQIKQIIRSYRSMVIRTYCRVRFVIMRIRFLEELDQYIPVEGRILDLGCGFGLFSLYFASCSLRREIEGVDLNAKRIDEARRSAARLGLQNVRYACGDVLDYPIARGLACAYTLDLLHHIPRDSVRPLLLRIRDALVNGGLLLVKDVDAHPFYKRWFTLALDRLMVGMEPIHYWPVAAMLAMLEDVGFDVYTHEMRDILPYPHRLYICRKR